MKTLSNKMKTLVAEVEMKELVLETEEKWIQKFAVDLTLDPKTAHPDLKLSGRFYFEVQVKRKTEWDLGVTRELSKRKGNITKVGVFVDYEEGLVSFYDVEAAALIYSFTGCSFKKKLLPYFYPGRYHGGRNSAPLIISPVGVN
ncbi:Pyrin [Liparis tanakae]|uniref:Pyrin n=1 Tax=Liparis tanakae TaxID=230148 RepID=A0A4Z2E6N8_9TELE|nr:Pyrin [Liparis tanakae]